MTIQEFKKKIQNFEKLEKEIMELKHFISQINIEKSAKVTVYSERLDIDVTYEFNNQYVKKMANEQLETMLDSYNYYIEKLKENGLEITSAFKK